EPTPMVGDAVRLGQPGNKETSRERGEQHLLTGWCHLPDPDVWQATRVHRDIDIVLRIEGDASDAASATLDLLTGLDLRVQRQARKGRLPTIRGDLADLAGEVEADVDVTVAVDLDALRRLRDYGVEDRDGLDFSDRCTRRAEGEDNGQGDEQQRA